MITKFTKQNLQALRVDIQAALTAVGEKHGIQLTYGNASFNSTGLTFSGKLAGAVIDSDGSVASQEAQDFKTYAALYDMKPEDLGFQFEHDGAMHEIIGLSRKAPKYPILVKNLSNQKTYKFTADLVLLYLGQKTSNGLTTGGSQR